MPFYEIQVVMQDNSGLPEDNYVNNWKFRTPGAAPTQEDMAEITAGLTEFYIDGANGNNGLMAFYAPHINDDVAPFVNFYLGDQEGSPVGQGQLLGWNMALVNQQALPAQDCVTMTYHADLSSVPEVIAFDPPGPEGDERPRQRRRNWVQLGPLNVTALSANNGQKSRPSATLLEAIRAAGARLKARYQPDPVDNPLEVAWVVDSDVPVQGEPEGPQFVVTGGWVKNTWGSVNRRTPEATQRILF